MARTSPPSLRIFDSLTKEKTLFSKSDPHGKPVTWYTCGPTVYDEPHLGHARSAVSLDILRRIMRDYFGFKVRFVMNVTDVDDKIVLRGRYQYLGARLQKEIESMERSKAAKEAISVGRAAFKHYLSNNLPLLSSEVAAETYSVEANKAYIDVVQGEPTDQNAKLKMHIKTCQSAAEALDRLEKAPNDPPLSDFFHGAKDVLHPYLDHLYGSTIDSQDHSIFTAVARKYEKRYFDDMHALNVLDPDVITRATEFVPKMVTFIERIIAKGFAYPTADGSVYFDIAAFEAEGHPYPRLEPWSRNNSALRADGEGTLANKSAIKRHDVDFALWKASRPGEPAWPSPWNKNGGRPGWHIECSVMASEVLGSEIDIHSGGEDLRFPHHDNELAQSTAYWSTKEKPAPWVNHFIHTGHLGIQGLKMSKSLKNFITISEALERPEWTSRSLRICFLLGGWHEKIEVTPDILKAGAAWESKINNFFINAIDIMRLSEGLTTESNSLHNETPAFTSLDKAKADLHEALCDSFDTPAAMRIIANFVSECNTTQLSRAAVLSASRWITRVITIFGLNREGEDAVLGQSGDENGSGQVQSTALRSQIIAWHGVEIPDAAQQPIYSASKLRDDVRQSVLSAREDIDYAALGKLAEDNNSDHHQMAGTNADPYYTTASQFHTDIQYLASEKASAGEILSLCDDFRDIHLYSLDIYLEDRENSPALVRPLDASLKRALAEKRAAAAAEAAAKTQRKAEEAAKQSARDNQAKINPAELFKNEMYSEWDEQGIPTRDARGDQVTKNSRKKLVKMYEKQQKVHKEWLDKNERE
ncbi:MAG: hypothetical protein Q9165_004353 [Trypethelium subeluteriae]